MSGLAPRTGIARLDRRGSGVAWVLESPASWPPGQDPALLLQQEGVLMCSADLNRRRGRRPAVARFRPAGPAGVQVRGRRAVADLAATRLTGRRTPTPPPAAGRTRACHATGDLLSAAAAGAAGSCCHPVALAGACGCRPGKLCQAAGEVTLVRRMSGAIQAPGVQRQCHERSPAAATTRAAVPRRPGRRGDRHAGRDDQGCHNSPSVTHCPSCLAQAVASRRCLVPGRSTA
jgi:hypothetical protein